jgi:hypothetical protein
LEDEGAARDDARAAGEEVAPHQGGQDGRLARGLGADDGDLREVDAEVEGGLWRNRRRSKRREEADERERKSEKENNEGEVEKKNIVRRTTSKIA